LKPGDVWQFFWELEVKIAVMTGGKTPKRGLGKFLKAALPKLKTYSHLCKICLEEFSNLENGTDMSWSKAKCNQKHTSNCRQHLDSHKENDRIIMYNAERAQKKSSSGALDSGVRGTAAEGPLQESVNEAKARTLKELMTRWLVFHHLPHETTQTPEFKEMLQFFDKKFVPLHRRTFNDEMGKNGV